LYCIVYYCILFIVLYCIVLCCILFIVLYCIVLYCTVLYCTVFYFILFYCIVLYCAILYCIVLYCIVLYCIVLYCIVLYCIALCLLYQCYVFRHLCEVDRTVVVCGLVELLEQNKLIETHRVSNLETTNYFRTQDLCDVILSRSVSVFWCFGRKQYILFAILWYTRTKVLTALICHLVTLPLDTCALKWRPCDAGYCLSGVLNWSKGTYFAAGMTTTKNIRTCGRSHKNDASSCSWSLYEV
jgi:hypothetical protein